MSRHLAVCVAFFLSVQLHSSSQAIKYGMEKGQSYRYHENVAVAIDIGPSMLVNINGDVYVTVTVEDILDNGNTAYVTRIDSAEVLFGSPMSDATLGEGLKGYTFKTVITNRGKTIKEAPIPENLDPREKMILTMAGKFFPVLPDKPLQRGESWETTEKDTTGPGGAMIKETVKNVHGKGERNRPGYDCKKFNITGKIHGQGVKTLRGKSLEFTLKGEMKGSFFFEEQEGLLVQYDTELQQEETIKGEHGSNKYIHTIVSIRMLSP